VADFYLGQGDLPLWNETLTDGNGNPLLIQGGTITMSMVPIRGGADVITAGGVVTNDDDGTVPNRGKVHRQMLTTETATSGDYLVRVIVSLSGKPITFPNTGYFLWTVTPSAVGQQHRYLGVEQFKESGQLQGQTYADEDITRAIEAASKGLENAYNTAWTLGANVAEIRFYTSWGDRTAILGDVMNASAIAVDYGFNQYDVTLTASDYMLEPASSGLIANSGDGTPFQMLRLTRSFGRYYFPEGVNRIRVTGRFGWEKVPSGVTGAVGIIASRLLRRTRDAPFGIIAFGSDGAALRAGDLARDPEVTFMMSGLIGTPMIGGTTLIV
jgi:hypothetical protein